MSTTFTATYQQTCHWCGFYHTGVCPMATAIEYYPDGRIKRVEFGQRQTVYPGSPNSTEQVVYVWKDGKLVMRDGAEVQATPT